ncbi:MAG: acetyl-CoA carboxylase biotin carboxylase subunit [Candidatus Caldatribacterium sp.]|uniref:acetyl-CoA carboxylase biotin carboxylase subunit n=1 Tax=Candidatus Caldatribacterium sp. TaxID=2282143 RepID=UPI00299717EF|nr:acetyl-CoA carboxylase biotin carboxylase subunit [Candidatus Caldatribacterium sp.]MCX7729714.1 acetyl-CoA carboxylase biotin carboxylase subunit [Candidatus Caldatribacterium sp.]MDW8081615.1 acetyl-CoA carboxylase biotin carboxylase subunit [Candidatus Calescibacterium sp.]
MFSKILIANRGEIALRVVRACRELGVKTVGVFSDADANLLHLRFVDQKVALGGNTAVETYLNIPKIIRACEVTGADAVHPGYGFLAENATFVEELEKRGIAFIGPDVAVLKKMKNKLQAKRLMHEAEVPVIPGSLEPVKNFADAHDIAKEVGFPLLLKACLGGGGRGIRVIADEEDLKKSFDSARREAQMAFGSAELYIEKLVNRARHIEVQILADRFGNVVHLGERECSLQRRRQKILEEAPAVNLPEPLRLKILDAAVRAAKAIGYTTCGTFEFLVTPEGEFYFMELNARIQVEHPVTEEISGVDLVREQIRLAAGERLLFSQEDVVFRGHAIEMRINAEDPEKHFAPSPGRITQFEVPRGPGIRVDSHCYSGYTVPPYYDSLIAKLIVWDCNREFAIRRSREALRSFTVEGIATTIPFHLKILSHPDFLEGNLHTRFLEEAWQEHRGGETRT